MEIKEESLDNKPDSYGTTSYILQKMDSHANLDELDIKQESIESISNIDIYKEMDIKEEVKLNNESYESDGADKSSINIAVKTDKKGKSYSDSNENLDELDIQQESIESISNIDIYEEMDIKEEVKWNNESYESDAADKSSINIAVKTDKKGKSYSCSICGYRAMLKHNLAAHIRSHTGEKPYSCSICDYKASHENHLTLHMRSHPGEKPFSCSVCNYKATQKNSIILHMRFHAGEKHFICSICDYMSTQRNNVILHMKSHTREKLFNCFICGYKTRQNNHLTSHIRYHTGEKPYGCSICDYKATHKSSVVAHMRSHRDEKPYFDSECKTKQKQDLVMQMRKKLSTVLSVNAEQEKKIL